MRIKYVLSLTVTMLANSISNAYAIESSSTQRGVSFTQEDLNNSRPTLHTLGSRLYLYLRIGSSKYQNMDLQRYDIDASITISGDKLVSLIKNWKSIKLSVFNDISKCQLLAQSTYGISMKDRINPIRSIVMSRGPVGSNTDLSNDLEILIQKKPTI